MAAPEEYRVEIKGGDESGRTLLATVITATLKKEGFINAVAHTQDHAYEISPNRMLQSTIAQVVEQTRPDLFKAKIEVQPMEAPHPKEATKIYLSASDDRNGVSISDTRGDVGEFMMSAELMDVWNNVRVESRSLERVGEAVAELLNYNPNATVVAALRRDPDEETKLLVGRF